MSVTKPAEAGARRVVGDVLVQIVARILNLVLGIFVTLVLVRGLGSHSFGVWSTVFAVSGIAANVGELGLNAIAVNRAAREPDREQEWLGVLLALRLILAVPIAAVSIVAVLLISPTTEAQIAGVIISCSLLTGAPGAIGAIFQLRVRNHISMAIMTFNSVIWGAGVFTVALLSGGIVAYAIVFVATSAVTTAVSVVVALRMTHVRLRGTRHLWPSVLRLGVPAGIAGMLVTLYVRLDQILVFDIAGSRQAGLYGAANRLLEQIQFIPAAVMTTLFPLIVAAHARRSKRAHVLLQGAAEYLAMASLPILAFTIVAARPIVIVLFGDEFAGAAAALPMLAGAFVSISFGYLVGNMVVALELQRRFARYAAAGLVLNVILNVLLIPSYGFVAAAWITVATEVTVMTLSMRMVLRALEMRPRFERLTRILLAATVMGVAIWVADRAGASLALLIVIAAAIYCPALLALRVVTIDELRRVIARDPAAFAE